MTGGGSWRHPASDGPEPLRPPPRRRVSPANDNTRPLALDVARRLGLLAAVLSLGGLVVASLIG